MGRLQDILSELTSFPKPTNGDYRSLRPSTDDMMELANNVGGVGSITKGLTLEELKKLGFQTNPIQYHGGEELIQKIDKPTFLTPDRSYARFFQQQADEAGKMNLAVIKPEEILDLVGSGSQKDLQQGESLLLKLAKKAKIPVETEDGFFSYSPAISDHSPYEGTNVSDLMYIPSLMKALEDYGKKGIRVLDQYATEEPITNILTPKASIGLPVRKKR